MLQWLACDLHTGQVINEIPDLGIDQVQHTMSAYDTATATLPVASIDRPPPSNWLRCTEPYKSMLVALDDNGDPAWGGIVTQRQRKGGVAVQLGLVTPEGYTARRFVRDTLQYPQVDRLFIASDLLNRYVVDGAGGLSGLPLRVEIDSFGQLVDGDYADTDDRTVYSILQDLGGEWTFGLEWQTNPSRITPFCLLSERLGQAAPAGLGPAVTLDWPGNLIDAQIVEDYSDGKGANDVMATSTGQGSVRPQSAHQNAGQSDRPTVEARVSAGSNIVRLATLNAYAAGVLASMAGGAKAYALSVSHDDPAAFTIAMGDDVGVLLSGPEFPDNPSATVRLAGLQLTASTVSPILVGSDDDDG